MNNKKKIVISNYDDIKNPDYAGGASVSIFKLAKHLSQEYDVLLITGKYPGSKDEIVDGVNYKRIGSYIMGGKIGHLFYLLALPFASIRNECDLWIESFTPPFSVSLVPLFLGKNKVVGLVHMLSGVDMKRKYKLPFNKIEHLGLKLYEKYIVLTEASRKEILKSNPNAQVSLIPNGINIPSENSLKVKKKSQILFIGRIEVNQKGLDLLIKSYKKAIDKIDAELVIAGTGMKDELHKLDCLITKYNLINKIRLVGRVGGKAKDKLIRESHMIIVPSRFETFGITALEALSNKITLICFDITGFKWLPKNVAFKIIPFSVKDLSQTIIDLFNNPRLRNNKIENGYRFSARFAWKDVFLKYDEVIKIYIK
ncbi:MAG: hypothetical protein US95_C0007G0002 [Candidatus Woesebacteria bacterium GW2011_GWB1_38_5]|uniref:Glycosyltransferase n=4 Tax=Candidatus Woeseibacteriota TaxID=1752722 RepID=A0A0G0NDQ9_9BACT|nr:MAG: hypothetical protein US67_C0001G0023 [Candidatus Woesebacteria bacterium GW2011_GWD1_38_10]KKQ56223.1 MAG: hypothetical protein US75_C0008G0018 [Candidatus Woesebacteria bacterium GW2011_GWC1_38_13]KKQ75231.1 MAG: hypothetical protein US95_C0007G0002 [Candidatus Woesebacteria bacterium GW2011_GWB1_38_5]KKQ84790.1 MAG: hypothetical protein UT06_C0001G0055 [Candidatus Woesebacteria bacterium GW2011_GWA1_38_8]